MSNTPASVSFGKGFILPPPPPPVSEWPGPPLSPLSESVKDRDRELIQQCVWCIFKQLWTFSSFQPTEDLISYNLISGWNHTAYLSNIKYLPFSLSSHLTENRKKRILFYFPCISPHLHSFIWHLKEAVICQVITIFFWKENVQVPLGELWMFWRTGRKRCRRTLKAPHVHRGQKAAFTHYLYLFKELRS